MAELSEEIWLALQVISLNFLANGCTESSCRLPTHHPSAAQTRALARLRVRARDICAPDRDGEPLPTGPQEPCSTRYAGKRLNYSGKVSSQPLELTADQIEPGLPPEGAGGSIPLVDFLDGDLSWFLEDPTRCLLAEDERPSLMPVARVHVADQEEWSRVVRLLLARNLVRVVDDAEIPRHNGRRVLQGAFLVPKAGKFLHRKKTPHHRHHQERILNI